MKAPANPQDLLRHVPKVDRLLECDLVELQSAYPRKRVVSALRKLLDRLREEILAGDAGEADLEPEAIRERLGAELERGFRLYYQRVVNATGVILHTGLGRACLPTAAVEAIARVAAFPQRVEVDLETGERGGRDRGCEALIQQLTGAEAATVVNNNAAATLVILAALARDRRVLVSRGELVEIGGSYRVPDIMRESGARLAEVGTTNRTHLSDYASQIDDDVAMILKVHTSNYRVIGFTTSVDLPDLVALGRERGVPVVYDLGSGCLADLSSTGHGGEALVQDLIATGVDLVCFSGDKLLGGPQAGIIAGRSEAIATCRRHPLFRAMRPGRLIYTALEATLRLYLGGDEEALRHIPVLERLARDVGELEREATRWAGEMARIPGLAVEAVECTSRAGSGSMPTQKVPSFGLQVVPSWCSVTTLAAQLRRGEPAILPRIRGDALVFDLRTLGDGEVEAIHDRLQAIAATAASGDRAQDVG